MLSSDRERSRSARGGGDAYSSPLLFAPPLPAGADPPPLAPPTAGATPSVGRHDRSCQWCYGEIRRAARRDSKFCSQSCRQASNRFVRSAVATAPAPGGHDASHLATRDASSIAARRLTFAYADPPYPGLARRYYQDHPDYAGEVDVEQLLTRLTSTVDGWALSTSAAALRDVLAVCPRDVRVAAWFRGARPGRSYSPLVAWEPVVYRGARRVVQDHADPDTTRREDALVHVSRPRLTDPARVIGAKPAMFAGWLFTLLGMRPGDSFIDVFPGSGGMTRAWLAYERSCLSDLADASGRRAAP